MSDFNPADEKVGDWRKDKRRLKRLSLRRPEAKLIDASFFYTLAKLANSIKNLVTREGQERFPQSPLSADIAVMLNQLNTTFQLICFLNADERRDNDPDYRLKYSFVALPLVRTLIDGFYNITVLLNDPGKARVFRLSGYKRMLASLQDEELLYCNQAGMTEFITQQREMLRIGYTSDGFTAADLHEQADWVLLGAYLSSKPQDTAHKALFRRFLHGQWRQYSEISHVTFRGIHELFEVLNTDNAPHDVRPAILERAERALTQHLGRSAAVLLAVLTEIQAVYHFEGHNINSRLHAMWKGLCQFPDGLDLFQQHYEGLLARKHITDTPSDPPQL